MHVHHDDVDVLTNQPTFDFHMENLRNYMCVSNDMAEPTTWGKAELSAWGAGVSMHGIPGDVSSPSRFVRVAYQYALSAAEQRVRQCGTLVPYTGLRADGRRLR